MRTQIIRLFVGAWALLGVGLVATAPRAQFNPVLSATTDTGTALPANLIFEGSGTTNGGTYPLGTPASNRRIVVAAGVQAPGTSHVFSGMVINGVTASRAVLAQEGTGATANTIEIWYANVPAGSTGVITITAPGATGFGIAVYALYSSSATPHATNSNVASLPVSLSTSVATVSGGFFVTAAQWTAGTSSWSGATKDGSDVNVGGNHASFAHAGPNSGSTANVTANISCGCGGVAIGMVIASWGP